MILRNCRKLLKPENTSIEEANELIYISINIFGSQLVDIIRQSRDKVSKDLKPLLNKSNISNIIKIEPLDNETDQENDFVEKETISKTKISYYHVYQKITKQQALNDIASTTNSQNVNQMYNEDGAFFTMLDDYIAFILVWSKILYHKDSTKHVSNAIIENHN